MESSGIKDSLEGAFGGLNEKHFKYLLLILSVLFFCVPLVGEVLVRSFPWIAKVLYLLIFMGTLMGASSIASRNQRAYISIIGVSLLAVLFNALYLQWQNEVFLIINHAIIAIVLIYVIISLTRYLFICRNVTQHTLYAALCSYLLIALLWALVYGIVDMLEPGAFRIPLEISPDGRMASLGNAASFHGLYFSLVTITTLGYGDVSPLTTAARVLSSAEAVVGQMFLAITIARLVGIYSSRDMSREESDG